jgi:hypothetical protein
MGLITYGAIIYIVGKIIKNATIEKVGFWMLAGGVVLFAAGFFGFALPLPIPII